MNRRTAATLIGSGAVATLAGCLSTTTAASLDSESPADAEGTIQVSGTGSIETDPDKAVVSVAIEAADDDADAVVTELAQRAETLRDELESEPHVSTVTTDGYSLREHSRRNQYEGQHSFIVEIADPEAVGDVIDRAVDTEADSVGRINFTISESRRSKLYEDAVDAAVDDAEREAELYLASTGQQLGEPAHIETTQTRHTPSRSSYDVAVAEDTDDAPPTAIDVGDVTVSAAVTITYQFTN